MKRWKPIESAPKDGTRILVCAPKLGANQIAMVQWANWGPGVWQELISSGINFNPTHWMPLPEPPKEEK